MLVKSEGLKSSDSSSRCVVVSARDTDRYEVWYARVLWSL